MVLYSVKEGENDFKPNDQKKFTWDRIIEGEFILHKSMWFDWESWQHHPYDGLNKLGLGLTYAFSSNSNRSCMFAYFPDKTRKDRFDIYAYTNDKRGDHSFIHIANIPAGASMDTRLAWVGGEAVFSIRESSSLSWDATRTMKLSTSFPWYTKWIALIFGGDKREIGGWFGGRFPSPKDSTFEAKTTLT